MTNLPNDFLKKPRTHIEDGGHPIGVGLTTKAVSRYACSAHEIFCVDECGTIGGLCASLDDS